MFRKIVRVSNPHLMRMRISITWKADSLTCRPPLGIYKNFDTTKVPCWTRP